MAKENKQVIVTINPASYVYGKKNKRITGDYVCDKEEADRLILLGNATFKEEAKAASETEKTDNSAKDKNKPSAKE